MRIRHHVTQAARSLLKSPAYVAAFVITLGLAIGVNSAVFSLVNGVLLQPLPFQDAERILYLKQPVTAAGVENTTFSFMEIDDFRAASSAIDEFVEFGDWDFTVAGEGEPHRAVGGLVTSNYFGVLGMRPAIGRLLNQEDDEQGAEPVMLLTDAYWERVFGRDPSVLDRTLDLTGVPTRVVGVLEPGLHYTGSRRPDFYVNYATNDHYQGAAMRDARTHRMTDVFARLAPGSTLEVARAELTSVAERFRAEYPDAYPVEMRYALDVVPWREELTRQGRPTFLILMGTVVVILVLAAANVANLTLTRLIRRENELATRGAIGADGRDLRLHLTAENVLLALGGAALGLFLAFLSRDSLAAYASRFTVRAEEVGVDWTVLGVTLLGGIGLAVALAWLPGLPVNPGLQRVASFHARATESRWRKQLQRGLVVGQLALSFTLLAGAALLVRSLLNLAAVDPGFETESVLSVQSPSSNFGVTQADVPLFQQALDEIRARPGVRSAAVASWVPLAAETPVAWGVRVEGEGEQADRTNLMAFNDVSSGFFETLGVPLVSGRYLDDTDLEESEPVVVINQSMAEAHFGDSNPVGRRLSFSFNGQNWSDYERVVGVVADAQEHGIGREGVHTVYRPASQGSWGPAIIVASDSDPAPLAFEVRDVIHGIEPDRAVDQVRTLADLRAEDVAPSRLNAMLFGSFAALALAIAAVGVLGTLGFSVSQRLREFGIRMALGADRSRVLGSVLGEGLLLLVVALALGAAGAIGLGRVLSGLLFAVDPIDPASLVGAALVLTAAALFAALLPALRAVRVHPSTALRAE